MSSKPLIRLVGALMLLVLTIAIYAACYSIVTVKSIQAALLAAEIIQGSDATSESAKAKTEISQLASQQGTVDQYFVSTSNVVPFIDQLQAIGNSVGANLQVVSVSASTGAPYGELNLSVSITGSFDAVMRTIGSVEYEPYNTAVTSLSLSDTDSSTASSSRQWGAAMIFTVGAQTGTTTEASMRTAAPAPASVSEPTMPTTISTETVVAPLEPVTASTSIATTTSSVSPVPVSSTHTSSTTVSAPALAT